MSISATEKWNLEIAMRDRIATFRSLPKDDDDDVKDNVNMIKKGLSHLIWLFYCLEPRRNQNQKK